VVWVKLWGAIKKQSENRLYDFCPCSHRGESASSFRNGAIRFCTCLEKQGSHRGHREHGESKHRGESAPSFRDGAIRFCICLEKQGSHGGHREHREKVFVNTLGTPTLVWLVLSFHWERSRRQQRGVSASSFHDGVIRFPFLEISPLRYNTNETFFWRGYL